MFHFSAAERSSRTMILAVSALIKALVRFEPIQPALSSGASQLQPEPVGHLPLKGRIHE